MNKIREGLHYMILEKIKDLNINNTSVILDLGCGDGEFLNKIHEEGFNNLHGIEGYSKNNFNFINFKNEIFHESLSYNDNFFDVVLILDLIEHIDNIDKLLTEIHRVLKKDGMLILSTPNIFSILGKISFLFQDRLHGFRDNQVDLNEGQGHITPFIPNIFELKYKNKYKIIDRNYFGFIIPIINKFISINSKLLSGNSTFIIKKII